MRGSWSDPRRVGSLLVGAQFGLILMCLVPLGPVLGATGARPVGVVLVAAAGAVGVLALVALGTDARVHPVPAESARLRTSGIYAVVRHPMYLAVLLACSGVAVSSARLLSVVAVALLAVVLRFKARFEDGLLRERFGAQFDDYASRVPAAFPRLRRRQPGS